MPTCDPRLQLVVEQGLLSDLYPDIRRPNNWITWRSKVLMIILQ